MFKQVRVGLVAASLVTVASMGAATGEASASTSAHTHLATSQDESRAVAKRGAVLTASATHVTEGDRYTLSGAIESPHQTLKVTLQKYKPSLYGWDDPAWEPTKTVKVNARSNIKFGAVAIDHNVERYRAVVTYKDAKPFTSKPVGITVWRWIPLSDYDPYYEAEPYAAGFGTTIINGHPYNGWGAADYSHTGAWESKFTPGRHCTDFRGVLGVDDISADGSSATIAFTADDIDVYESPSLTPGMSLPVSVPLAEPYRFGIRLTDTTPGNTTGRDAIEAWPVIGDPTLLCTGI